MPEKSLEREKITEETAKQTAESALRIFDNAVYDALSLVENKDNINLFPSGITDLLQIAPFFTKRSRAHASVKDSLLRLLDDNRVEQVEATSDGKMKWKNEMENKELTV